MNTITLKANLTNEQIANEIVKLSNALSAVHHRYKTVWSESTLSNTGVNDELATWVGNTRFNYRWTVRLFKALVEEQVKREKVEPNKLLKIFEENHPVSVLGKTEQPEELLNLVEVK